MSAKTKREQAARRAVSELIGCPEGGWGETQQARRQGADMMPGRLDFDDAVARLLILDETAMRYRGGVTGDNWASKASVKGVTPESR